MDRDVIDLAILIKWAFDHNLELTVRPQINKPHAQNPCPNYDSRDMPTITLRNLSDEIRSERVIGTSLTSLLYRLRLDARNIASRLIIKDPVFSDEIETTKEGVTS